MSAHSRRSVIHAAICAILASALLGGLLQRVQAVVASRSAPASAPQDYAGYARAALAALQQLWLTPEGWRMCLLPGCTVTNQDWGADALTADLAFAWQTTGDPAIHAALSGLIASSHDYLPCRGSHCTQWSDVPMWDSIAASQEYAATGRPLALQRAEHAFAAVQEGTAYYALGACPEIHYQRPFGDTHLKTLETDSNYLKAALLLYRETHEHAYLAEAEARYAAIRARFLDPLLPLYTVYVLDDGVHCTQVPHRFFASVNGNMIAAGLQLAQFTGSSPYRDQAVATARAVALNLADARGIYADLQAENDIETPLVVAMYAVATQAEQPFARDWLLSNAAAAISARTAGGFGRFFDGPAPQNPLTAWQTNGGFALMLAAAALDPAGRPPAAGGWATAVSIAHQVSSFPASLTFYGSGIALIGVIGDHCCEAGHARIFLDGRETLDQTGIWQNKSSSGRRLPNAVLFAWRWPKSGTHTLLFQPGVPNVKEGGPYLHLVGYELLR